MKIEEFVSLNQPTTEFKKSLIRSISFHPTQRKVSVAYRHDIFGFFFKFLKLSEFDLVTGLFHKRNNNFRRRVVTFYNSE
jgi:hypothetical protein